MPRMTITACPPTTTRPLPASTRTVRSPPRGEHCRANMVLLMPGGAVIPPLAAAAAGAASAVVRPLPEGAAPPLLPAGDANAI